jgi:hypothetical protein
MDRQWAGIWGTVLLLLSRAVKGFDLTVTGRQWLGAAVQVLPFAGAQAMHFLPDMSRFTQSLPRGRFAEAPYWQTAVHNAQTNGSESPSIPTSSDNGVHTS